MRSQRTRLRSALYMSIADLFFGAAGVIIILVVFATRAEVARYPQYVDFVVNCASGLDDSWKIVSRQSGSEKSHSIDDWVNGIQPYGLIAKVGIVTPPKALGCYMEVERAVLAHNRALTTRSGEGGVISTVFLPEISQEVSPETEDE